jgi:tetratricopeptide (TPR) repeat protein
MTVRGTTGEANIRVGTAKTFELQGIPFHNIDFLVGEHSMGDGDDGSIGENMLSGFDAEFDFARGVIRLMRPLGCGYKPLAYWVSGSDAYGEMSIDPIAIPSLKIRGEAAVNGRRIHVVLDTGAPRSMMTMAGARAAGLSADAPGVVSEDATGGIGRRVARTWIAPVASLEIGGEQVKTTRVRFGDIEAGDADMVLGVDFFLSHRIYVAKSQNRLYFSYNGGPVFNLDGPVQAAAADPPSSPAPALANPAGADQPKDAAGYARRAAAFAARREYAQAITDYTTAAQLEPADPKHFYDLGVAHWMNRQPILAMGDFDQALKLKSDDAEALLMRGRLRLSEKDEEGAKADFATALKADPSLGLRVATDYVNGDLFEPGIAELDTWIASHPKSEDLADPLNERCWARALWNKDLDKALADCDEALSLLPGDPRILDSRGLVHFRRGEFDKAIADYSGSLKLLPRNAWSLYGRGLAEQKTGEKAKSDADLAAAAEVDPHFADRAKRYGVTP